MLPAIETVTINPTRPFQFTCHRSHVGGCKTGSGYLGHWVYFVLILDSIQIQVLKYKQELETYAPQTLCSEIPGERNQIPLLWFLCTPVQECMCAIVKEAQLVLWQKWMLWPVNANWMYKATETCCLCCWCRWVTRNELNMQKSLSWDRFSRKTWKYMHH